MNWSTRLATVPTAKLIVYEDAFRTHGRKGTDLWRRTEHAQDLVAADISGFSQLRRVIASAGRACVTSDAPFVATRLVRNVRERAPTCGGT